MSAGAIDLGTAADIASDVGSAFGLAADQIGHIADIMATTASNSGLLPASTPKPNSRP